MVMQKKMIKSWTCKEERDLDFIAKDFLKHTRSPMAVILTGVVGAGKTTFSKYFARMIAGASDECVSSPTYSIINEMENFVHADFFRVKKSSEIIHLEIPLYIEGKQYFFIEWGIDWLSEIKKELNSSFTIYELEIIVSTPKKNILPQERIFSLYVLD
ncbi:MAG: tRNA (adenosine(37)-N6)-threonylcarbamoyltransferase complex ATPase subunit type 1 TsaE [Bdellovibrionales bacterium RIFOXYB1_FULL_37_110]|nr:MAG: tRNA (adenosine(37)-N6)-threonylcarbamoyltransferase complex ATPase subunit type 1 TsaE [Bdellovibrionales bacterium RIFOXYC1_FULL_37_79]OFZ61179.1 MAG: tRNA (adenosine(37)-N6)-threonylcarbamoyltransferase complex ATPase subunit type 1 TsaE [Bdellovibrionales bacterium RIFOXYB1_FULL_37_110]OFZ65507.1 MAG: tRNA (adenosine(37)-N6)-threonylcarbamoyltransferase complex ATPase subunit type 1 TsaE [Bdellovibrionales bacterium RIFOXYD1_FULL_36_51]